MALRYWVVLALAVPLAVVVILVMHLPAPVLPASFNNSYTMRTISIGPQTFSVEVADTEALRELGLGQRPSLPQGQGMLFVFDHPGSWGFWMKDMQFPLDMLWMRGDGTVTTIDRNVATSTYPAQVFYPATPDAVYVLELNAGAAANLRVGEQAVL